MSKIVKSKATVKVDNLNLFSTHNDRPRFTGKRIVMMNNETKASFMKSFAKKNNFKIASIKDFSTGTGNYHDAFSQGDGIYFDTFKMAIINAGNDEPLKFAENLANGTSDSFTSEPERFVYAWPKAAVISSKKLKASSILDNNNFTWGTQAIKVSDTKFTGKGINVAILDTGLNLAHPDFNGINIQSKSFVENQLVEDGNGHGTHCCGISVGAVDKKTNLRYGVASGANLFVGKVLSNAGSGSDGSILAGIEWALQNECKVISMSLGAEVKPGETFSPAYEKIAQLALKGGCLIVAATGNESERQFGLVKPVGHPANCPSILSVAAIDSDLNIASFSCGGINPDGGQVDIAAPGVDIFSSWKGKGHNVISGTSMATPFVAGTAALYWEAKPKASASDIWMLLTQNAFRLDINSSDVGSGLLQVL